MMDNSELLERVKAATGPSHQLDAEIYATLGGAPHTTKAGRRTVPLIMKEDPKEWPDYTGSIDAALALVERLLPPDTSLTMKQHASGQYFHVEMETDDDDVTAYNHPSLPLAILAALLTALKDQTP